MNYLKKAQSNDKILYSNEYFSNGYNHTIYLKKAIDDGSNRSKIYLSIYSYVNGIEVQQGYLYFYLDFDSKTSDFIGLKIHPEYRNLNIGSLLISNWINLCLNNGFSFLGTNEKQRKPFLLYLLKTYGFEIPDTTLYNTRNDVIKIYNGLFNIDKRKILLFKDSKHENIFIKTNSFKEDNYLIIHDSNNLKHLDDIIMPLQNFKKNKVKYKLLNLDVAEQKVMSILNKHKK
ncbi:MAG: hypothetical protein NC181_03135 [Clostridium sp.]|nr:hypothetical protein [Clostridium sp.]MCM1444230.1 hypothetical protein [Candidatus Amulumruptor caecigallinarius]